MRHSLVAARLLGLVCFSLPCLGMLAGRSALAAEGKLLVASELKLNNLVSKLLEVEGVSGADNRLAFDVPREGWVFISASCRGTGAAKVSLTTEPAAATAGDTLLERPADGGTTYEAMRRLAQGKHVLRVDCQGDAQLDKLVVKTIPELIHCGLGFNSAIKGYGAYDLDFLKRDILPNVTTLVVPSNIELPTKVIEDWHAQGKKFVAEVGIQAQAKTADEHFQFWIAFFDKAPFLDGILINEFIVNNPASEPGVPISPQLQKRREDEQARHRVFEEALKRLHAEERYRAKQVYAYFGGSGKKLNQEMIGPTFVRTLINNDQRIALERYVHEMSSEEKSQAALRTFVDGIADWEATQPGAKRQMVITFGLFSMPPGGINKQPNVDYHVWMDQQMNLVANDARLAGIAGLEWWTSLQADEETVRFVGKLYRHYAIEGRTDMLTRDPLFLAHVANADFEKGLERWTLQAAEPETIAAKSFPRYGRIEGRFMGLGRPPDPEHIGDAFLWMKRSEKGPNTFSQTIQNLQPGRLYSLKMFSCDYQDLVNPQTKKVDEATGFIGRVTLEGIDVDQRRSFSEIYASNPEPKIPVWITYHWKVFRAQGTTAKLVVSDWPADPAPVPGYGQEQTFNFLEIQPYHE